MTQVEIGRVARRLGGSAPQLAANLLSRLDLLAIEPIVADAVMIGGPTLRSLDAIHLATAASIVDELGAVITYDRRMLEAGTRDRPAGPLAGLARTIHAVARGILQSG